MLFFVYIVLFPIYQGYPTCIFQHEYQEIYIYIYLHIPTYANLYKGHISQRYPTFPFKSPEGMANPMAAASAAAEEPKEKDKPLTWKDRSTKTESAGANFLFHF